MASSKIYAAEITWCRVEGPSNCTGGKSLRPSRPPDGGPCGGLEGRTVGVAVPAWPSDHLVAQLRLAAPQPAEIVAQNLDNIVLVAPRLAGGMRRDQRVVHAPERRRVGERLLDRDVD